MSKLKLEVPEEINRSRHRTRITLIVVLVLLTPFIFSGIWLYVNVNGIGSKGKLTSIEIKSGAGTSDIGKLLEDKGVVRSGKAFAVYTKLGRRGPYQAGQYDINKNLGASAAADVLEKGPKINYEQFTILPGERFVDVAKKIDAMPNMSKLGLEDALRVNQFKSKFSPEGSTNLEGLLLPETYSMTDKETEADIIRRSLQEFDARASANGLTSKNDLTTYQIIIVASLIEREARYSKDRPKIASVIYNRLAIDMRLQIDATVLYGLGRSSGPLKSDELKKDTPYNTYTRNGLVPTPISMISMDSLRAALNPADTNYLYYVLSDSKTGQHAFSDTYEGHLQNIQKSKSSGDL